MRTHGSAIELETRRRIAGQLLLDGKGVREVARLLKTSKSAVSRGKHAVDKEGLEAWRRSRIRGLLLDFQPCRRNA